MSFKLGCVQDLEILYRRQRTAEAKKIFYLQIMFLCLDHDREAKEIEIKGCSSRLANFQHGTQELHVKTLTCQTLNME